MMGTVFFLDMLGHAEITPCLIPFFVKKNAPCIHIWTGRVKWMLGPLKLPVLFIFCKRRVCNHSFGASQLLTSKTSSSRYPIILTSKQNNASSILGRDAECQQKLIYPKKAFQTHLFSHRLQHIGSKSLSGKRPHLWDF